MQLKRLGYALIVSGFCLIVFNWIGLNQNARELTTQQRCCSCSTSTNIISPLPNNNNNNNYNINSNINNNNEALMSTQNNNVFDDEPLYVNRIKEVQTKMLYNCREQIVALQVYICFLKKIFFFVVLYFLKKTKKIYIFFSFHLFIQIKNNYFFI